MEQTSKTQPEIPKAYEPSKVESKWYQFWLKKGYFTPNIDRARKPFVIIMPPPNITGELHLGHALTATLEDVMIRWHRMKGDPSLWLPGVDHAGIATQVVVERQLAREGLTRQQLGRENFTKRMMQWAVSYRQTIDEQHQRLGASCDWSRERFTIDEVASRAVRAAFVNLFNKGLIYRGERLINWCPRCATAVSDLEVDHEEVKGNLWYVRYKLADAEGYITVATTRPETILGDSAIAVNPNDDRFKALVGKHAILPVLKRVIPIIADDAVDPAFGTGAVKITPGHDPVDFEVAQRHSLPIINILNLDATMNANAGPYAGMDRFECRKSIVADLEKEGLLVKIEPYVHSIGHCQRCRTIVEPIISKQWFVKTAPLAKPAIEAVENGSITILPERFTKVYLNWMENIRDWCISRQLWWGHRIPVWYCHDCNEMVASVTDVKSCLKCGSIRIEQDPDVLDTWFSSGLWPHSTLGWPQDTEDLRYFYPTSVMETAYDILFFWVARMIMMGIEDTGKIPFHTVYLHGLIRDEKGEKMSKSKGNVLNPLELMDRYGTDALRFAVSTGTSPGNDSKVSVTKLEAGRNFANKLWNASRFVLRAIEPGSQTTLMWGSLPVEDHWILSRLNRTIAGVTSLMEDFQFGEAERQIHDFLWGDFCDWYIEMSKIRLRAGGDRSPIPVLVHVLETSLRLLHPYMPFITEEIWQNLKSLLPSISSAESIMIAPYPTVSELGFDPEAERIIDSVTEIIRSIRNVRAQYNVPNDKWVEVQIYAINELKPAIMAHVPQIEELGRAKPVVFLEERKEALPGEKVLAFVLKETEVVIPLETLVDLVAEKKRLLAEMDGTQQQIERLTARLGDNAFISKAPQAVVDKERARLEEAKDKLARLKEQLARFA